MRKLNLLTLLILSLFCYSPFISAQEILTAEEAINIALDNNFSIKTARNESEIAGNNASLGNAGFLPEVNASANYTERTTNTTQKYFDGRSIDRSGAQSNNLTTGVELNWTVFDGLRMFASYDLLKELDEIGEFNLKLTIENTVSQTLKTYYEIVKEQLIVDVIKNNILISEERLRIAESKMEVGSGSRFDLNQAQVDLNEDKSNLLQEELRLEQAKIDLNKLLGRDVDTEFNVSDEIDLMTQLEEEALLPEIEKNNTGLKIAERNQNISEAEIRLAKSDWFPEIYVNAGYDFSKSESEAGFIQSNKAFGYYYGVGLSLSLFDGLNTKRNIENAEIMLKNSRLNYQDIYLQVQSDFLTTYKSYINSLERVNLETENLNVAEENVEIALEKLRLGNITPLEFREVQTNLLDAKSRLLSARYDTKAAEVDLLRISGKIVN